MQPLGENDETTIRMRWAYGEARYLDSGATLDDLHEAVTTLTETERIARRVLGGAHPITKWIERSLRKARAALRALWCPRIAVFEEFCELGGDDLNNFVS